MCSARGLRSVAVTRVACCAACSAWMPEPVPRSRAAATGVRTVMPARVVEAPPTPRTTPSSRAADAAGAADRAAQVGHDEPVLAAGPAVRPHVHGGGDLVAPPARVSQPLSRQASTGRTSATRACGTGCWSRNSRTSVSSGVSPRVARSAGTVSLRASAAYAGAPSSSSRPSAVKEAPSRASRSRAATSGRSVAGSGGRGDWLALLTPPLWPPAPVAHVPVPGFACAVCRSAQPSLPAQRSPPARQQSAPALGRRRRPRGSLAARLPGHRLADLALLQVLQRVVAALAQLVQLGGDVLEAVGELRPGPWCRARRPASSGRRTTWRSR